MLILELGTHVSRVVVVVLSCASRVFLRVLPRLFFVCCFFFAKNVALGSVIRISQMTPISFLTNTLRAGVAHHLGLPVYKQFLYAKHKLSSPRAGAIQGAHGRGGHPHVLDRRRCLYNYLFVTCSFISMER